MAVREPLPYVTPEEYLRREREAEFKSEYLDGVIYAMSGGSPDHSAISANVIGELRNRLRGSRCQVHTSDLRNRTSSHGLFSYPDVSVVCGKPEFHDEHRDVLTNPILIVEVLSPTTEAFDRGEKWRRYQEIDSLLDYVLVSQSEPRVEHFDRRPDDTWRYVVTTGLDGTVYFPSINIELPMAEIYYNITFPQSTSEETEETA